MSNQNQLGIVVAQSFEFADRIVAKEFDYGDGSLARKRAAIALNQIARAADDGIGLKQLWQGNMLDDNGKKNIINGLKTQSTHDADDAVRPIWDHMSDDHKKLHLENHPGSGFHVTEDHNRQASETQAESEVQEQQDHEETNEHLREGHKRRNRNKRVAERDAGSENDEDGWWNELSMTQRKKYLRDHPKSKKARRFRIGIRNMAMKATKGIHREIRAMGKDYENGMAGLRAMRGGRKMDDEQKQAFKNVAKRMSKLLLGALVVSAMFTPLGPFAAEIGNKYADEMGTRKDELEKDHVKTRTRREDGVEVDEDGNPTTVGQPGGSGGSGSDTTVGQTEPRVSQSSAKRAKARHVESKKNEVELDWMRRDMTEWLMNQDVDKLVAQFKPRGKK